MTTAQLLFALALGTVTVVVVAFTLYVLSSTVWGDRWMGRRR